jgi:hypothetical protein
MSLLANEIIIDGILYNTKNETDRRFIGLYEERKLLTHFINNNIHIEHISNGHKFCQYDFLIKNDGILYIIELKSRLGNIKNHTYELLSISKIDKYKRICKKNIKCIFIFNHIDTDNKNNNDYYYYDVDFNELDEIAFKHEKTFELSTKYIKPLEELFLILKKNKYK